MIITDRVLKNGTYEFKLFSPETAYADLVVHFKDPLHPRLVVPLTWRGDGDFYRLFRVAFAVQSLELVVNPDVRLINEKSIVLNRVGFKTMIVVGFRKLIANLSSPVMFAKKLRYYLSGSANVALEHSTQTKVDESAAYRHWRMVFERTDTVAEGRVLAVYVVSTDNVILQSFLSQLENRELDSAPSLLLIEFDDFLLVDSLRTRALKIGAEILQLEKPDFILNSVFAYALSKNFIGIMFLERLGSYHKNTFPKCLLELAENPETQAVYSDSDCISLDGERSAPFFKPDWSQEYLHSWNYIGSACVFRVSDEVRSASREVQFPHSLSYSLLLSLSHYSSELNILHIPLILFHEQTHPGLLDSNGSKEVEIVEAWLQKTGGGRQLETWKTDSGHILRKVSFPVSTPPVLVSVLIPTRDNPKMLQDAIRTVLDAEYPAIELVIIDNGSTRERQLELLESYGQKDQVTVIRNNDSFNFSALMNKGRKAATGDVIILLNDDTKSLDNQWLTEMVTLATQPDIGCVGALLVYPNNSVQHDGVVLGIHGGVEHAFRGFPADKPSPGWRLQVRREVSAVTAACLAVRADVFDQVNGLDETLAVAYNDIDFCLKVRQLGLRNLVTPHAKLIHFESATRGLDITQEKLDRVSQELAIFLKCWETELTDDPFYSPHLSRNYANYEMRLLG